MNRLHAIGCHERNLIYTLRLRTLVLVCALAFFLPVPGVQAQNKPDPLAGPLFRPIDQLRADPGLRVYAAVVTHDHKTLQSLLDSGDSPNGVDRFQAAPLTWACRLNDLEAVTILLKSGAEIDLSDPSDESPLFAATRWRHPELVRYLIAHGAQVNARRRSNGETALYEALRNRNFDLMTLLIESGADVNLINKAGNTPLMIASLDNDYETIRFLESKGAKFNSPDEELLFAASNGDVAAIQRALSAGAPVNQSYERGVTPLMAAALNGQTIVVKALIAAGADVNARDEIHDTPLFYAIKSKHRSTIFALLDAGADPTLTRLGGATSLLQAATYIDDPELVRLLIQRGVPIDGNNDSIHYAPLMAAAAFGSYQTAEILIEAHAPINAQSKEGRTALMDAATSGQADILTLLLRAGADPSIKDKQGKIALDYATQMGQQEAIAILQKQLPQTSGASPAPDH